MGGPRNTLHFNPKFEFPSFNGTNARSCIKRCVKYISLCKILNNQKVDLASMHQQGQAKTWHGGYSLARRTVACKLSFSKHFKIHNVLHVSPLKLFKEDLSSQPHIPLRLQGKDAACQPQPKQILSGRIKRRGQ